MGRGHPITKPGEEISRESGGVVPNEHLSSDDLAGVVEALTGVRVTPPGGSFGTNTPATVTVCSRSIVGNRPQTGAGPSARGGDQCPELGGDYAECLLHVGPDVLGDVRW
jgi:hypothetical protein